MAVPVCLCMCHRIRLRITRILAVTLATLSAFSASTSRSPPSWPRSPPARGKRWRPPGFAPRQAPSTARVRSGAADRTYRDIRVHVCLNAGVHTLTPSTINPDPTLSSALIYCPKRPVRVQALAEIRNLDVEALLAHHQPVAAPFLEQQVVGLEVTMSDAVGWQG